MKKTNSYLLVLLLTPLFLFLGCDYDEDKNPTSPSKTFPELADQIKQAADSVATLYQIPGMIIGVKFDGDENPWIETYGVANLGFDVELEWDDRFKTGSITKTYVATVVLQLVDEDLIELDKPCQNYLPNDIAAMIPMHQYPDTIMTVRSLLNHTSGLINYNHTNEYNMVHQANPFRTWQAWELLSLTTDSLTHKPGTIWNYSNTGYIYLQLMVEHLTGNTIREELDARVFEPLELTATEYSEVLNPKDMVDGYWDFDGNGVLDTWNVVTAASPTIAQAAGAIVSNAEDMLRWIDALVDGELLSTASQEERLKTVSLLPYAPISFGLGIIDEDIVPGDGKHVWGHIGGIDGFTSALFRDQLGNDIVVLVNGTTPLQDPEHAGKSVAHEAMFAIRNVLGGDQFTAANSITNSEFISTYRNDW